MRSDIGFDTPEGARVLTGDAAQDELWRLIRAHRKGAGSQKLCSRHHDTWRFTRLPTAKERARGLGVMLIEQPSFIDDVIGSSQHEHDHLYWAAIAVWARHGLQTVSMPDKFAAALMATDVVGMTDEDVRMPWPSFMVHVPPGLIEGIEALLVSNCEGKVMVTALISARGFSLGISQNITEMCRESDAREDLRGSVGDSRLRSVVMARRLVINTCLEISTNPPAKGSAWRHERSPASGRQFRVSRGVAIGRPLTIDCRRDVRDYISGTRQGAPAVQTLVRGHWRRQVHGPGNSLRKLMWIQPFYRGDGPMLVRPTRIGFGVPGDQPPDRPTPKSPP